MDEDARNFLQQIHDSLARRTAEDIGGLRDEMNRRFEAVDARFDAVDARFDTVATTEQLTSLENRVTQMRDSMMHFARHAKMMLSDYSRAEAGLAAQVEDLRRRMDEVERRLPPPEAAA